MTVAIDKSDLLRVSDDSPIAPSDFAAQRTDREPPLKIALLNNMPDSALQATERQYVSLLQTAAGDRQVRLHFYSLPSVVRSADAQARIDATYEKIANLTRAGLDGLIVTAAFRRTLLA
jgi:homoserine O-succinyltransferase/O-acetyltransferase